MKKIKSITASLLMVSLVLSACSSGTGESGMTGETVPTDISITEDTSAVVPDDTDSTEDPGPYYTSKLVTIPQGGSWVYPFAKGSDEAVFVVGLMGERSEKVQGKDKWTAYVCGYDGEIKSHFDLPFGEGISPEMCVDLGNGTFVARCSGCDYMILDYEGKIVKKGDTVKLSMDDDRISHGAVCRIEGGFALLTGDALLICDAEGNEKDKIDLSQYIGEFFIDNMFVQNNEIYALVEDDLFSFYRFGLGKGTLEKCFSVTDVKSGSNFLPMFEHNYKTEYSGAVANLQGVGVIKIDMANKAFVKIADKNRMQIIPPTTGEYDGNDDVIALDEEHFMLIRTQCFNAAENAYDSDSIIEVALISKDENADYDSCKKIVIQGVGVSSDSELATAVYYFNNEQDKYYIELDDLADKLDWSSIKTMKNTTLRLLTDYMNGNTPDIFYGNYFDYLYFGQSGMVEDMRPYLEKTGMFDASSITPEIYKLMTGENGEIYQVFAGYALKGFWGGQSQYSGSETLASLPAMKSDQKRFRTTPAADLLYDMIGADLRGIYKRGELDSDTVLAAVKCALENGTERPETYEGYPVYTTEDVGKGKISLFETTVANANTYYSLSRSFKDTPVFAGYPSAKSSSHLVVPVGLMALSSSASDPQGCCDFIAYFMSEKVQQKICSNGSFPVNDSMLHKYLEVLKNPESASGEEKKIYSSQFIKDMDNDTGNGKVVNLTDAMASSLLEQIKKCDHVEVFDWGICKILDDEIGVYYSQNKTAEECADTILSKLELYAKENYG